MEKTAVEWLNQQLVDRQNGNGDSRSRDEIFEQAKIMEKQQRQKDFKAGNECACMDHENIEDYFNQYIKSE